jgi:hypothetical protein
VPRLKLIQSLKAFRSRRSHSDRGLQRKKPGVLWVQINRRRSG